MIIILVIHLDHFSQRRPEPQRKVESLPIVSSGVVNGKRKVVYICRQMVFGMLYQQFRSNLIRMVLLCFGRKNHQ
jgi:hypothetical protein